MTALPNLFLIGAQKSGSSSLAQHLLRHPEIVTLGRKEPRVFVAGDEAGARAALASLPGPARPTRYRLDASVDYARYPKYAGVPELIAAMCPPPLRFLYIVRNPVERLISQFFWSRQLYFGHERIDEAIAADRQYVDTSRYDLQLDQYFRVFAPEQFLFVTLDELSADPPATANRVFRWLELEPVAFPAALPRRGETRKDATRRTRFGAVGRRLLAQPWLKAAARSMFSDRTLRRIARAGTYEIPREEIPREQKKALMDAHFVDSLRRLEAMTGLDVGRWITAYDPPAQGDAPAQGAAAGRSAPSASPGPA